MNSCVSPPGHSLLAQGYLLPTKAEAAQSEHCQTVTSVRRTLWWQARSDLGDQEISLQLRWEESGEITISCQLCTKTIQVLH